MQSGISNDTLMKRRLALIFFLSLIIPATVRAQSYDESFRYWNEGPLTLGDFTIRDMWTDDPMVSSSMEYGIAYKDTVLRFGNLRYQTLYSLAKMDRVNSWIRTGRATELTLKYHQVAFDIAELNRRKLQDRFENGESFVSPSNLISFYEKNLTNEINEYRAKCSQGLDAEVIEEYSKRIHDELGKYPEGINEPVIRFRNSGFGYHLGPYGEFLAGEAASYLGPQLGLLLGMEYSFKRLRTNWDISFGRYLGGLRKSVAYSDEYNDIQHTWGKDWDCHGMLVDLSLGFAIVDNAHLTIAPMVGIGGMNVELDREYQKEKDVTENIDGFRYLAGVNVDLKLSRNYSFGWDGRNYGENSIRLKLYVAKSDVDEIAGPLSINCGLLFNLYGRMVR